MSFALYLILFKKKKKKLVEKQELRLRLWKMGENEEPINARTRAFNVVKSRIWCVEKLTKKKLFPVSTTQKETIIIRLLLLNSRSLIFFLFIYLFIIFNSKFLPSWARLAPSIYISPFFNASFFFFSSLIPLLHLLFRKFSFLLYSRYSTRYIYVQIILCV